MAPVQKHNGASGHSSSVKSSSMSKFMCCTSEKAGQTYTYREQQQNQSKFLWLDPTRWVEKRSYKQEKISDIVVGQEDVSAKEALLRWAQRTTHRYPNVNVTDFTQSWRDGLAFNAIIHRNRSDLVDWKQVERMRVRERIELAFHVMEREYGVTRLLDPEDVDTPEPDEKSIITYVSQLYDVFPEPPAGHPLFDAEGAKKLAQYRELASSLHVWIRESTQIMQDRHFPNTLIELKRLAESSARFRTEEVPPRLREKEHVVHAFRDLERHLRDSGDTVDRELQPDNLERNWNTLMTAYQERDRAIQEEILRLEKLQRLAEKVHQEAKHTDSKLDDIEVWIEDEAKRVDHLHPRDAKANCDKIEKELQRAEEVIKSMFNDVQVLRDNRYHQANELHRRVQQVHEKWVNIRTLLQTKLINVLNIHTNPDFKFLAECTEWVHQKLKQIKEAEYGNDVQSVKSEYERHQKEHKVIDQFQGNVEKCREAEVRFHGEELKIYGERMTILQKAYNELLVLSNKRVSDLHTLNDFMQAAHSELTWLNEKEDTELGRDWADRNLNIHMMEKYYEQLMSDLERRETQFTSVVDRGESLIIAHHPSSKVIEAHLATMQGKWAFLLQLTLCLEKHLRHVTVSKQFFQECQNAEEWMKVREDRLNGHFSQSDFKLDEGENLLKEMQQLRDELSQYEDEVQRLIDTAQDIVPLRARRERLRQPLEAVAICKFQSKDVTIQKDEVCTVRDNSNKLKWKVTNSRGQQGEVPGNVFVLRPPDQEAIDTAEKLKRHYDRVITLWQKKHLRMRQNMIFATIKVVKSWDFQQFLSMGKEQRTAIRRALNEDSEKLIQEGEPNDPQLKRLQREIDEVNRLFDEWERRAALEEERKNAAKAFHDRCTNLEVALDAYEKQIVKVCKAPLPRDVESLQNLVVNHKQFESDVQGHEPEVNQVKNLFNNIPQKTPKEQAKLDKVLDQWDRIWSYSSFYVERLKTVEITLTGLEEVTTVVTTFEMKLASYDSMPEDMENLRKAHDELMTLNAEIESKQDVIDQLQEDVKQVRPAVEKTRPNTTKNPDVDRLEEDVNRMTKRWNNCCLQVVERLRSCEAACELLEKYNMSYQAETGWMDQLDSKLRNLEELEAARAKEAWEKHVKAVQEKFRQASENLDDLNGWLDRVEREIASQEILSEDVNQLKSQIHTMTSIKSDVDEHNRPVNNTLDIIVDLVENGHDVLSSADLNQLQAEGKRLKERYTNVADNSDKLLKRMYAAMDELAKFRGEMGTFRSWMEKAFKTLEDKERQLANLNKLQGNGEDLKAFVSDVMTHGADLKFLTMSGQKFVDLSKEYIACLNEFRVRLRASHLKQGESIVSDEVTAVSGDYHELLTRANRLSDRFSRVGSKQRDYNDSVDRAKKWLGQTEPKVAKICSEPIGAEPRVVEDQLNRAKALHNEIIANRKLIDDARQAAFNLLSSLDDGQLSAAERRAIEETPNELQQRYDAIAEAMANRCADLDSALVASQGIMDALGNIEGWLNQSENQLKNIMKPASLIRERLDEQIRQVRVLQADIDSHEPSLQKMYHAAQDFMNSAQNVRESKKIETKVKEVQKKFEVLVKTTESRAVFLDDVSRDLDDFTGRVENFDEWYEEMITILESREMLTMDADESAQKIDEISRRKDQKRGEYEEMMRIGKSLVGKKDVTDTTPCKDTLRELESKWDELGEILGERQNLDRARKQSLNAYEQMRMEVTRWLSNMERKIDSLEPVAVDPDILKRQSDEIKPMVQEHGNYSKTIDKFNEIAIQYDSFMRGNMVENGSASRRQSVSPRKSSLTPALLSSSRRPSSAITSKLSMSSPRRESSAPLFADQSPVQLQLTEVNNRYDMIGIRLNDRERDIVLRKEEIKVYLDNIKQIHSFLEKQERNFPRENVPTDKKESDKMLRTIKGILDQLYENQPLLDETKVGVKDILKKNRDAPGAPELEDRLGEVVGRWKELQDKCKMRVNMLDELKDFHDLHDSLNNWLNAKGRMLNVLGPIASDPRLVQNQMSQIAVMREEFNEKLPQKDRFNEIGDVILENGPDRQVEDKLGNINNKWDDLLAQLEDRERALDALSGPTRDFMNLANKLTDNLGKISDGLDDVATSKADPEQKMRALEGLSGDLDSQRPILAELESVGDQLMNILTDPASRSEIKGKMGQVERQFNNCQKKLDNALAELENSAREAREFETSCADMEDMLRDFEQMLADKLAISANKDILRRQVDDFEPLYQDIMSKEHEVIMILNRGRDLLSRSKKGDSKVKGKVDNIERSWQKIKKTAQDRQKRLNTSMEYCRKYDTTTDRFLPWLEKAERNLANMAPISFVRPELQKQEKELQSFRNDVNRHTSEYEGTVSSGFTFLDSCDTDKEIVKDELALLKDRWEALNMLIGDRSQAINDILSKLGDFNDDVRDLGNNLNRMEDKVKALDSAPQDAKTLDAIKGLLDDTKGLDKLFGKVQKNGDDLINDADHLGSDASNINDIIGALGDRLGNIKDRLEDKADDLKNAGAALGEFNDKIKDLNNAISNLDDELNRFGPVARDLDTLNRQMDEVQSFIRKVQDKQRDVDDATRVADDLISRGFAPNAREVKDTITNLVRQLEKLDSRAHSRERDVDTMIVKVTEFYDVYGSVMNDIQEVISEERNFGAIGGDIESIKAQQEEFKQFQRRVVEAVAKEVEKTNRNGQSLIQSAASGVNTSVMERDLEKMNDLWNSLKQNIADRIRKLDQGLLQSGKFQEALNGLLAWMDEMDEMMNNQKPPSSDYKVIKAQVQEQKFVQKLLGDRKNAIQSLVKMGKEIAASADPAERRRIESDIGTLEDRYADINKKCADRMSLLEEAMQMAREYHDKLGPLEKWLDKTEKRVKDMETVPTEEDQIQRRIQEHDRLHDDILGKQPSFDDLADIATALMQVVGEEDAQGLADKIEELTNRYGLLVNASDNISQLLKDSMAGLRSLVLAYEDLLSWMEQMERKLGKYKVLSVFTEKLVEQMEELHVVTEEVVSKQRKVDEVLHHGNELMKNITNEEAIQLKDKLDSLQRKYNDLATKAADLLKNAQEMLPLVQNFHEQHNRLNEWMTGVEGIFQSLDTYSLEEQEAEIKRLEQDVSDNRPILENITITGPQLSQMSPGDGARTIEDLVTRDNRRFDAICEQIQRRSERIQLSKQRSSEVLSDIDELLEWFREVEHQIREADAPSSEPDVIRVQLKEHKALNDDISSQKGRVRDVLSNAKKVLRESAETRETEQVKEKMDDLKETMETVIKLSNDRLGMLEQALPLAEHFYETHGELGEWFDYIEREMMNQLDPGMRPDQIAKQQEINRSLIQSVQDHKPVLDRLNKTGGALLRLIIEDDAYRVNDIIESDNQRYNAIKVGLRERQQALEDAMQECSQFTDKLDGMLNALQDTADQVNNAEPVSAHPEKIREQMDDNNAIIDDLAKKEAAFNAVKGAAADIIAKAPNKNDPAIKDIKKKLDKLNNLWDQIQKGTKDRSDSLEDALALAEKFWDELQAVMQHLKDIQENLLNQEPPAVEPKAIEAQKDELKNIKRDIDSTKPGVEKCRKTGKDLISMVGDADKPELRRHIDDLDNAWDNITSMYAKREQNLLDAMEKAMEFHNTLQELLDFLAKSERKFDNLGPVGSDIDQVKKQIAQLKTFKDEVDPWMIKVEALNRQASDLTDKATAGQARAIKEPLAEVNRRWEDLNRSINGRQKELENALLRLGQFQHALNELLIWIERTDKTLDTLKPVFGDPQVIEVELAKLKVMVNDIQAHQSSVDTLNDAGRQIIESADKGSREASTTQNKLNELNTKWNNLLGKAEGRQVELEDALREAQAFNQEIQDMLLWLNDVDAALSQSKPVGGLPETARDQLERFMEVFRELEGTGPKVESLLGRGNDYLKKSKDGSATNLQNNLRTLKSRWENILNRANDKKIKLEIALKEATEFHEALQAFIDWLTHAEKHLANQKSVSRVLETIKVQIEEHKDFQNEVSSQRETMLSLDKKGTHLKYFSQKQDVILIKNLLVSVQHRWEKVVSKSAERTRALDYGYKEAKEFHDAWEHLCGWLDDAAKNLDELSAQNKNDPQKIKKEIARHKEFQKELSAKQPMYDSTMKNGKQLKEKAPKPDEPVLKQMLVELKNKWMNVCNLSVEKQRKLEEALLFSGQFKDALKALMDWLKDMEYALDDKTPVHGDLDTVIGLVEKHKNFEQDLNGRTEQVETLKSTAEELLETADREDAIKIKAQITELTDKWENVWSLSKNKTKRLEEALKQAEELHKSVNMLLEWLSDAEMKLRFSGPLPEDEDEVQAQIREHEKFMAELKIKEKDKDFTLDLAKEILSKCHPDAVTVIKHWITIIQSRWDEVASWALQRRDKLEDHLKALKDILALLDELMQWLIGKETTLTELEREPLPDDLEVIKRLIDEHQGFMDGLSVRQPEIDSVCKPMRPKSTAPSSRRTSKIGRPGRDSRDQSPDHDPSRRPSRVSPGDRSTPDRRPRFDRKGSRASVSMDQGIKNPRAKALWDKWRHVWMMAWERDRRLKDKLSYLNELENVKNFNWEEWRKRFLKFHNNKKSRVTDLMRKLDEDADGFLQRDGEFVEGVLKAKFPSSRLEMNAVADMFDDGDGQIDWRKFMAALRPDWEDRGPLTDMERIDDEITRQVASCTCKQKFKVFQVGEGKYRFGESQKLRLVRILRSTVMVRVGGGWCALDEFLVKNDPCRAKGRTNVELREQFTLASGVSQSMTPFKSRPSISGASGGQRPSISGPITKIKEKSERSLPMRQSFDAGAPYDDQQMGFTSRRASAMTTGQRNGSSRGPSRAGSNVSLNSDSDSPRGSSVRRSSSMRSGGGRVSSLRTPVGFGSSSPRKSSTPLANGNRLRTNSNSSTDRTPMSARVRSKSYITPRPSPLIKTASATNIPVFVGCYSSRDNLAGLTRTPNALRSRTPSSSSIPVPINQRTRTPSGSGASTTGRIQRSGSGYGAGGSTFDSRRTSKTTTSYGADGSRITATTTTYGTSGSSTSQAGAAESTSQQRASRNW